MLLYPFPALTTPFPAIISPFLALITSFPFKIFPNVESPKVPNNKPRDPPSCLFILCFTVSLTPLKKHPNFLVVL